ncbi:hypothetical protein UA08_05013 [Talaromyces atroroseus]|uniref:Major facilitator superfamily (MFS) profile domain-containing protein n=1 Tax=Talaromyces atroroseus TaxID=1441469 RepID=A0A225AQM8_TALAT|nr:hypothetical protein UA08_05013 [Talaromyces atroroseus]OKL59558.1 hypothetical protein UA08_05013 [Talaromyces atroroseus]
MPDAINVQDARKSRGELTEEAHAGEKEKNSREMKEQLEQEQAPQNETTKIDPNFVTWDGPDDLANPKNWKTGRKWAVTFVVSSFTLISPLSSSILAPALSSIGQEFNITNDVELSLALSIFVLAYAIGPLFLGPLSELYGRSRVLQLSNLFYFFFNLGCALARSKAQIMVFRFFAGLGGSAPLAIGGAVLGDLFTTDTRGRAIAVYSLAPLLGPAIGPIAGGFITQNTSWRWIFYATTMADGVIQLIGLYFLRETFAPLLLQRKKNKLIKETGNPNYYTKSDTKADRTVLKTLQAALVRPFRLLATQPIIQVLALYMAYVYGLIYIVLSTFPTLWTSPDHYDEKTGIAGLNYISLGVGFFLGTQIFAPLQDRVYRALKARTPDNIGRPEFRVVLMFPGALIVPFGLFIYGWTAEYKTHWIAPNIGAATFAAGTVISFQCIQAYVVDSYTRFAASALAASTVLRSLAGFGFPLFGPYVYSSLGYGWGNSLLAFLAIGLGWPAPFLLWRFGEILRKKSPYAAG